METINNVAAAASKTIFGDGSDKKEPVSGATGDVAKGEPYDAGNLDPEDQKKFESLPTPGVNPPTSSGLGGEKADDVKVTDDPTAAATTSTEPTPKGDTTAGQTDVKDKPTLTSDHPEEAVVAEPTGPGPKPVAVLAREHGGDAGQANHEPTTTGDAKPDETAKTDDKKESEGTGEKVVHASGLAADGGDFDASKPGAGVEADRLLEEKGITTQGSANKAAAAAGGSDTKSSSSGKKDKPSLSERIKAKFHKK